jgi:hypothetical protein
MSCTTTASAAAAAISSSVRPRTRGWMISFNRVRASSSPKTTAGQRGPVELAVGRRRCSPNAATTSASPSVPPATTSRAIASASMSTAPRSTSRRATSTCPIRSRRSAHPQHRAGYRVPTISVSVAPAGAVLCAPRAAPAAPGRPARRAASALPEPVCGQHERQVGGAVHHPQHGLVVALERAPRRRRRWDLGAGALLDIGVDPPLAVAFGASV